MSVVYTPLCPVNPQYSLNVAAYLGAFNPADVCASFRAGAGTPVDPDAPRKFSFQVPAYARFELVVSVAGSTLALRVLGGFVAVAAGCIGGWWLAI